jgi:hypothetical protein
LQQQIGVLWSKSRKKKPNWSEKNEVEVEREKENDTVKVEREWISERKKNFLGGVNEGGREE